jgi:hypothetical protein
MVVRTCILSLALALLLPAWPRAANVGARPDAPDPDWRFGPVRYILLVKEDQEYNTMTWLGSKLAARRILRPDATI